MFYNIKDINVEATCYFPQKYVCCKKKYWVNEVYKNLLTNHNLNAKIHKSNMQCKVEHQKLMIHVADIKAHVN